MFYKIKKAPSKGPFIKYFFRILVVQYAIIHTDRDSQFSWIGC